MLRNRQLTIAPPLWVIQKVETMKKITYAVLSLLSLSSISCSEILQNDKYHKLSSEQHFNLTNEIETILSHNNELDTLVFIGLIKAQFEDELYTGIHCKGPYDYIEFERIYYALKQDTSFIKEINEIKSPFSYYGYCHASIPKPEECIQFSFGYPKNTGQIINAPVLTLNGRNYFASVYIDTMSIEKVDYTNIYKYQLDSIDFMTIGKIKFIYMTKHLGVIKIEIINNYDWNKIE